MHPVAEARDKAFQQGSGAGQGGMSSGWTPPAVAYRGVSPRERPKRRRSPAAIAAATLSPILGSQLVFPLLLGSAVKRSLAGAEVRLDPQYARHFFGTSLQFWIDPGRLRLRISDVVLARGRFRWVGRSFLDGADWSRALSPITRSPVHREMSQLVAADLEFRVTQAYRLLLRAAREGRPATRNGRFLRSAADIDGYFEYCADLVRSMRANGVVWQGELRRAESGAARHRAVRSAMLDSVERDIGVAIALDGTLIRHLGGKHRTAVAQALHLPRIPVELRMVHVGWLAGEMARTGLSADQALTRWLLAQRS